MVGLFKGSVVSGRLSYQGSVISGVDCSLDQILVSEELFFDMIIFVIFLSQ